MSQATLFNPAAAPVATALLWPIPLPIVCVCGEVGSGKTLFGLTMAEPASTLVIDEEGSSASYQPSLGFTRLSLTHEVTKRHPKGFQPLHAYEWFRDFLATIPKGKFRVGVLDTMAMIDAGLTDWVEANPAHFNHTAAQYQSMSGMKWGDVDEQWKVIISECEARFETFVFVAHMKEVFADKKPTGKRRPGWKKAFDQRASLILQIERKANAKGERPDKPSAIVLKDRLSNPTFDSATGEFDVRGILPPRLPTATPKAIREYMLKPPDFAKLKIGEKLQPEVVSEEELLAAKTRAAEAQAEATKLELEKQARLEAAEARRAAAAKPSEPSAQSPPPAAGQPSANHQPADASTPPAKPNGPTEEQLLEIGRLREHVFVAKNLLARPEEQRAEWLTWLAPFKVDSARSLTHADAEALLAKLRPF